MFKQCKSMILEYDFRLLKISVRSFRKDPFTCISGYEFFTSMKILVVISCFLLQ